MLIECNQDSKIYIKQENMFLFVFMSIFLSLEY